MNTRKYSKLSHPPLTPTHMHKHIVTINKSTITKSFWWTKQRTLRAREQKRERKRKNMKKTSCKTDGKRTSYYENGGKSYTFQTNRLEFNAEYMCIYADNELSLLKRRRLWNIRTRWSEKGRKRKASPPTHKCRMHKNLHKLSKLPSRISFTYNHTKFSIQQTHINCEYFFDELYGLFLAVSLSLRS